MLAALIPGIMSLLGGVLDRVLPGDSPELAQAKLAIQAQTLQALSQESIAQANINQVEAGNASVFVAGWRPFIGWVCGVALCYHFILLPLITFITVVSGANLPALPIFDMATLQTILMGMLGLGAMRSYEKVQGVANTNIAPAWKNPDSDQ